MSRTLMIMLGFALCYVPWLMTLGAVGIYVMLRAGARTQGGTHGA